LFQEEIIQNKAVEGTAYVRCEKTQNLGEWILHFENFLFLIFTLIYLSIYLKKLSLIRAKSFDLDLRWECYVFEFYIRGESLY
jgi:hypothetical protein